MTKTAQEISLDPESFKLLVNRLQQCVELLGGGKALTPWKPPTDKVTEKVIRNTIESAGKHLPLIYQKNYLEPMKSNLSSLLIRARRSTSSQDTPEIIREQFSRTIEILAGAVYCHVCGSCVKPLRAFLAVISNTYRSFLPDDLHHRNGFPSPLENQYPPLAAFRSGEIAPFMLSSDAVAKLTGGTIGVVVLPTAYKEHPLLWTAIAHEVGGHELLNAIPNLLVELQKGVRRLFNVRPIRSGDKIDNEQLMGLLWQYWAEETISDVCGVLNIGPSYGISLAIYQAALDHAIATDRGVQSDTLLRLWSGLAPQFAQAVEQDVRMPELDVHPTDILKLHVIIGVVENLITLLPAHRDKYVTYLRQLAEICASGKTKVDLCGTVRAGPDLWIRVNQSLPLAAMQDAARRVGAYIATVELNALGGHCLQGLETWDDADEVTAQYIAACLLKGQSTDLADMGDDAQVLAASTLAFVAKPGNYDQLTSALLDALEVSCARDPYWGVSLFHSLVEYKLPDASQVNALQATQGVLTSARRAETMTSMKPVPQARKPPRTRNILPNERYATTPRSSNGKTKRAKRLKKETGENKRHRPAIGRHPS